VRAGLFKGAGKLLCVAQNLPEAMLCDSFSCIAVVEGRERKGLQPLIVEAGRQRDEKGGFVVSALAYCLSLLYLGLENHVWGEIAPTFVPLWFAFALVCLIRLNSNLETNLANELIGTTPERFMFHPGNIAQPHPILIHCISTKSMHATKILSKGTRPPRTKDGFLPLLPQRRPL